jgi:hypothetical protein
MTDKIERLLKNYTNARQSWDSWYFMTSGGLMDLLTMRQDYSTSPKKKVDENVLLSYLRYLAFKDYHIEIYKIVKDSNNTKDNIFLLLKEFATLRPDLKKHIESNLKELAELQTEIKRLTDLRDKFYAHLDADYLNYGGQDTLDHYFKVFTAVENAIITLTSKNDFETLRSKINSDLYHLDIK